jgi:hypothetical protein
MKKMRDRIIYRKLFAASGLAITDGRKVIINRIKTIIMLKAITMCLNFKGNTPIEGIIRQSGDCVNDMDHSFKGAE